LQGIKGQAGRDDSVEVRPAADPQVEEKRCRARCAPSQASPRRRNSTKSKDRLL